MKKSFINLLIFSAGAAIGSAVTWKIVSDKYEKIIQDEIDSVKEAFGRDNEKENTDISDCDPEEGVNDVDEQYEQLVQDLGYTHNEKKGEETKMEERPIIIRSDELGEIYEYDIVSLTYYADGVVTDDTDNVMEAEDIEQLISSDALKHFGEDEFEPDMVCVRNHSTKSDYEITKDLNNYYSESVEAPEDEE